MASWSTILAVLVILAPGLFVCLRRPDERRDSATVLDELSLRNRNVHVVLRAAWLFANVRFLWEHIKGLADPQIRLAYESMNGGLFSAVVLIVLFGYTTLCVLYLIACRLVSPRPAPSEPSPLNR
ncbi:hypothetical protein [Planctomyces sp. SH-PL14]|uniref:hypothetical protein n=1 Tax=Planctomyces sp. SH-PL14 TaxID=1632864 RepID=UPI00078E67A0|nr:hypothetical protein [Planctomyces sp. SH-PL14]AMV20732.1 hypothetical protein VT03_22720 [Planctomyces sp. SH-PL14]